MNKPTTVMILAAVCIFQAGWILGSMSPAAWAEPVEGEQGAADDLGFEIDDDAVVETADPRLLCKTFKTELDGMIETADPTTEVGQWVDEQSLDWQLFTLDFEVGQKTTGYQQGWVQVCLSPKG